MADKKKKVEVQLHFYHQLIYKFQRVFRHKPFHFRQLQMALLHKVLFLRQYFFGIII